MEFVCFCMDRGTNGKFFITEI